MRHDGDTPIEGVVMGGVFITIVVVMIAVEGIAAIAALVAMAKSPYRG